MKKRIIIRIALHLLFWSLYLLSCILIYGFLGYDKGQVFRATLMLLPAIMLATYLIMYFIVPKYLLKKRYVIALLSFVFIPITTLLLQRIMLILIGVVRYRPETSFIDFFNFQLLLVAFEAYLLVSAAIGIRLFKLWIRNQKIRNQLEVQNLKSELGLMKAQVNPHFLFNTLNNIHSYIHYDKEKSADAVIKLSEIMRYMLYETSGDKVQLSKEISYIRSYISLQLLRFETEDAVKLNIKGNPNGKSIAPMLFISFLENAFKHGNKNVASPAVVIDLDILDETLIYEVSNYINPTKKNDTEFNGFGIRNLKKRLLLLYPEKHQIDISVKGNIYIAKLILNDVK